MSPTARRRRARSARTPRSARRSIYAIDREALTQVVFNGEFVPGNQWVNPEHPYFQKNFPVTKRDVAKAKALIKEAGVTTPIDVDFMVPKGAETQAVAEVIQAMAAEVGINMKIRVTEFATSLKQAETGEFQAYLLAWSGRTDPDGNLYIFHKCKAPQNYANYCNAEVDKLLDKRARSPIRPSARRSMKRSPKSSSTTIRSSISITAAC